MPNHPMHWCTCRINLSGQNLHIVVVGPHNPISWPEVQVLSLLHGEDNIHDLKPCGVAEVNPSDEKRRLWARYGKVVEQVFPGRVFRMELTMPGEGLEQKHMDGDGIAIAEMGPDPEYGPPPDMGGSAVFKPGRPRPAANPVPGAIPSSPSPSSMQRS